MDEGRGFTIIDYEDRYKQALEDISLPWLLEYDLLEHRPPKKSSVLDVN